jgi:hypothetical protein
MTFSAVGDRGREVLVGGGDLADVPLDALLGAVARYAPAVLGLR